MSAATPNQRIESSLSSDSESSLESIEEPIRQRIEEDDGNASEPRPVLTAERLNEFTQSFPASSPLDLKYGDHGTASSATNSLTDSDTNSSNGSSITVSDLESQDDDRPYEPPTGSERMIKTYFRVWTASTIVLFLINCLNMDWKYLFNNEPWWMIILSITFFCIQGILQWSVLELPLMSFASLFFKPEKDKVGDGRHLTVLINYNLLASYKSEVDQTMMNAFVAYTGNLGPSVASVLVSATGDEDLKAYELEVRDNMREQISELVLTEGKAWARGNINACDPGRALRLFEPFRSSDTGAIVDGFIETILPALAEKYANDFMVIQRVTRGTLRIL